MPANLTPQYLAAEQRYKEAAGIPEKIAALEEMLAVIPKHKGTEKMQADLKRRLAKLSQEAQKKHGVSKATAMYTVPREGAGQVVLVGAPNTGKSSLLKALTHATPEIGDYPFTTRLPQPGMMPFENIQVQMVDMPPFADVTYEPWMGNIVRQCDMVLLVVDAGSEDMLDEVEQVIAILAGSRVALGSPEAAPEGVTIKPALVVATRCDVAVAAENVPILREFYGSRFEIVEVSAQTRSGIDTLRRVVFQRLDVIRVYTKVPGKKPDMESAPFVLKRGSTVLDLARMVHRDFVQTLKYARAWSRKLNGQMVERTHLLEDGDIVELHG